MTTSYTLRTIDLARAAGVVVEVVRSYERLGLLPAVERAPNGYRCYEARHMAAMRTARTLIQGVGRRPALAIMQSVHAGDSDGAVAYIQHCHAQLDRRRTELLATLELLRVTAAVDTPVRLRRPVTIGAAARLVGVEVVALRLWERQGLLAPRRDRTSGYRLYDARQIQQVQVVALLWPAGYSVDAIRQVLTCLASGNVASAIAAAEPAGRRTGGGGTAVRRGDGSVLGICDPARGRNRATDRLPKSLTRQPATARYLHYCRSRRESAGMTDCAGASTQRHDRLITAATLPSVQFCDSEAWTRIVDLSGVLPLHDPLSSPPLPCIAATRRSNSARLQCCPKNGHRTPLLATHRATDPDHVVTVPLQCIVDKR